MGVIALITALKYVCEEGERGRGSVCVCVCDCVGEEGSVLVEEP